LATAKGLINLRIRPESTEIRIETGSVTVDDQSTYRIRPESTEIRIETQQIPVSPLEASLV